METKTDSTRTQSDYWKTNRKPRSPYHPISRFFSAQRWEFVGQFIDMTKVHSVLDVGCGKGLGSLNFDSADILNVGVDFSQAQLVANELTTLHKAISIGEQLPFPDSSFDLAMCWELLHHVDNPSAVVTEIARVSARWIVIFEPNMLNPGQFVFSVTNWAERGSLRLRRSIIEQALQQANTDIRFFGKVGWVFPNRAPMWLFQFLRRMPFRLPVIGISRLWIAEKRVTG